MAETSNHRTSPRGSAQDARNALHLLTTAVALLGFLAPTACGVNNSNSSPQSDASCCGDASSTDGFGDAVGTPFPAPPISAEVADVPEGPAHDWFEDSWEACSIDFGRCYDDGPCQVVPTPISGSLTVSHADSSGSLWLVDQQGTIRISESTRSRVSLEPIHIVAAEAGIVVGTAGSDLASEAHELVRSVDGGPFTEISDTPAEPGLVFGATPQDLWLFTPRADELGTWGTATTASAHRLLGGEWKTVPFGFPGGASWGYAIDADTAWVEVAQLDRPDEPTRLFRWDGQVWAPEEQGLERVSGHTDSDIWARSRTGELFHNDGLGWRLIASSEKLVGPLVVANDGALWSFVEREGHELDWQLSRWHDGEMTSIPSLSRRSEWTSEYLGLFPAGDDGVWLSEFGALSRIDKHSVCGAELAQPNSPTAQQFVLDFASSAVRPTFSGHSHVPVLGTKSADGWTIFELNSEATVYGLSGLAEGTVGSQALLAMPDEERHRDASSLALVNERNGLWDVAHEFPAGLHIEGRSPLWVSEQGMSWIGATALGDDFGRTGRLYSARDGIVKHEYDFPSQQVLSVVGSETGVLYVATERFAGLRETAVWKLDDGEWGLLESPWENPGRPGLLVATAGDLWAGDSDPRGETGMLRRWNGQAWDTVCTARIGTPISIMVRSNGQVLVGTERGGRDDPKPASRPI